MPGRFLSFLFSFDKKVFYFHDPQTKQRLVSLYNVDLILGSDILVDIKMANKM